MIFSFVLEMIVANGVRIMSTSGTDFVLKKLTSSILLLVDVTIVPV